jgi:spore germination protein KA
VGKRKNVLQTIFSWLSYKDRPDNSFYLSKSHHDASKADESQSSKKPDTFKRKRNELKKPKTFEELKNKDTESTANNEDAVSKEAAVNIKNIEKEFNFPKNKDIVIRSLSVMGKHKCFIFYIEGLVDRVTVNNSILKPLLNNDKFSVDMEGALFEHVYYNVIETNQLKAVAAQKEAAAEILSGNTGVFIEGFDRYIICETKGFEKRSVEKPQIEGIVKGPQEAFNENLRTNITLLRRIVKNKALTTEFIDVGDRNNAKCAVIYLEGLINPAIVKEIVRRVKSIRTDFIMGDGILEQYIEDCPWSIVPTILSTERPDRTAFHILSGKAAIIADGAPFALIVPITLKDILHTPEDTTLRWQYGTVLRLIRFFAIFVATLLPGLYVALTTFHREMIPTDLLIAIAKARENVPFPTLLEVFLMEISFELIREAGIRIPGIIGNTIGIIGALILGQAAVQANLVSPVLIIIIAFTGLGNFAIPDFTLAFGIRIMRIFYIILGAFLGFYGISLGILVSMSLITHTKSFGVPIMTLSTARFKSSRDYLIRWPLWKQESRPGYLYPLDDERQPKISRKWTESKPKK